MRVECRCISYVVHRRLPSAIALVQAQYEVRLLDMCSSAQRGRVDQSTGNGISPYDSLKRLGILNSTCILFLVLILVSVVLLYGGLHLGVGALVLSHNPSLLIKGLYPRVSLSNPFGKSHQDEECYLTRGTWCEAWKAQTPMRWKDPFALAEKGYTEGKPMKECLWNCNHVGVCDYSTGVCRCPAGWSGPACDVRRNRPCSQRYGTPGSFEPYDEPFNISLGYGTSGACAGYCDRDTGTCYCPTHTKYGRVPAPIGSIPGTPPIKSGRQLSLHCQPRNDSHGNIAPASKDRPTYEQLLGPHGWCEADTPEFKCPCIADGMAGEFCQLNRESFCINQCGGHGICISGFCKCDAGWYGHDCAHKVPGMYIKSTDDTEIDPWIRDFARIPGSELPSGGKRLRPLIYVYNMDPIFDQTILQYRVDAGSCVHRTFDASNVSVPQGHGYCSETGLHELFLQSPHRTLDPEEADFFFIPMYTACLQFPVANFNDFPSYHTPRASARVYMAASMMYEAQHWIRRMYPYWDRKNGRDHILLAPHDEGSCWVPKVLRNAIILTHWGYTGYNNHSFTSYGPDMFDTKAKDKIYQPKGMRNLIGYEKCVDPEKDLVIPQMFFKGKFAGSPFVSNSPPVQRDFLASHKGRTLDWLPKYSRGSRQNLTKLCKEESWWEKYKIYIGESNPPNITLTYSELLNRSIFCPVLMGEGFTTRFEDSVMHGCIPVIIIDDVLGDFETVLRIEEFSLRVSFQDMSKLPDILLAVSKEDIERMQNNIQKIWSRYMYNFQNSFSDYGPNVTNDAFKTIIQWLYSKL